ncbi:MAG: hypothetical protein K6G56_08130 [Clostridiales bacterium]|nr:hypothetical protein [Clostridiales bacterium]
MAAFMAKCPCCGGEIRFDKTEEEHVCGHCGTKLMTSALVCEPVKEEPRRSEHEHHSHSEPVINAPELTEEEIRAELDRKAAYKAELKKTVRRIDELRSRRHVYEKREASAKKLSLGGAVAAAAAVLEVIFLIDNESMRMPSLVIGGLLMLGAIALFIASASGMKAVGRSRERLEASIKEKKARRDELIHELNSINRKLHIHSH